MVTQHKAQRADFGPSWPEVAGFGEAPQQAIFEFWPQGKISKMCNYGHSCPACRLAEQPKKEYGVCDPILKEFLTCSDRYYMILVPYMTR